MNLFLIDAISPFFKGYRPGKRINWSKIPFDHLEKQGLADTERLDQISVDLNTFLDRAAEMEFNAVTLDDLAHMVQQPSYSDELNQKINVFSGYYKQWIDAAKRRGVKVYITTDFMFLPVEGNGRAGFKSSIELFKAIIREFFQHYPDVSGIILRIGESDGKDVEGDFLSQLQVKTPRQAKKLVKEILPVFEEMNKQFIFRLWSVGAYSIGDLIWNRETLQKVFGDTHSQHLILSIKYGESDFFRHLALNKQFFRSDHLKILEVQARREYEGCGEYPSFIGGDYEKYRDELIGVKGLMGLSVWCQTGGWTRFAKLTFMDNSSVWNEINTWTSLKIFKENLTAEQAVYQYAERYLDASKSESLYTLLSESEHAVKNLLYIDEYAQRKLFFRRVRLPSTLSVYWDRILIMHPVRKILRCLVENGEAKIAQGERVLAEIQDMQKLAKENGLPDQGLAFMYDTFELLAEARRYYFAPYTQEIADTLETMINTYNAKYDPRYSVRMELKPFTVSSRYIKIFIQTLTREKRGYRAIDQIFTLRIMAFLFPLLRRFGRGVTPDFIHRQAMGIEAVFK